MAIFTRKFVPQTIVVKIGTQALDIKEGYPEPDVLFPLVEQLTSLKKAGHRILLVSSGAVGRGQHLLSTDELNHIENPITRKQIEAGIGQSPLMQFYIDAFAARKIHTAQCLLTTSDFGADRTTLKGRFKHYAGYLLGLPELLPNKDLQHSLKGMLDSSNIIPILNENDVTATEELRFSDNDHLASLVAEMLEADQMIILTGTKGVFQSATSKELIPLIDFAHPRTLPLDTNGKSTNGRGGMKTKLEAAARAAARGMIVTITAATEPDALLRIVKGEQVGTTLINSRTRPKPAIEETWLGFKRNVGNIKSYMRPPANRYNY